MDKKGQGSVLGLSFSELMVLIACAIVISIIASVVLRTWGVTGGLDDFTINSFYSLEEEIDSITKDRRAYVFTRFFPYFVSDDYVLVGFPAKIDSMREECKNGVIKKPKQQCGEGACLCIYEAYEWDNPLVPCEKIAVDDIFTYDYYRAGRPSPLKTGCGFTNSLDICKNVKGLQYDVSEYSVKIGDKKESIYPAEYGLVVIYGECDTWGWDLHIEQKSYFIEKYYDDKLGKTALFIGVDTKEHDIRFERYRESIGTSLEDLKSFIETKQFVEAVRVGHATGLELFAQGKIDEAAEAYYLSGKAHLGMARTKESIALWAKELQLSEEITKSWALGHALVEFGESLKVKKEQPEARLKDMITEILTIDLSIGSRWISQGILPVIVDFLRKIEDKELKFPSAKYLLQYQKYFVAEISQADRFNLLTTLRRPMNEFVADKANTQPQRKEGIMLLLKSYEEEGVGDNTVAGYIALHGVLWKELGDKVAEETLTNELCSEDKKDVYKLDARLACNALGFFVEAKNEVE